MLHRDKIVINKVISEIIIGCEILSTFTLEQFVSDEKLKRAVCMTVINIGEFIKMSQRIPEKNTLKYLGER